MPLKFLKFAFELSRTFTNSRILTRKPLGVNFPPRVPVPVPAVLTLDCCVISPGTFCRRRRCCAAKVCVQFLFCAPLPTTEPLFFSPPRYFRLHSFSYPSFCTLSFSAIMFSQSYFPFLFSLAVSQPVSKNIPPLASARFYFFLASGCSFSVPS